MPKSILHPLHQSVHLPLNQIVLPWLCSCKHAASEQHHYAGFYVAKIPAKNLMLGNSQHHMGESGPNGRDDPLQAGCLYVYQLLLARSQERQTNNQENCTTKWSWPAASDFGVINTMDNCKQQVVSIKLCLWHQRQDDLVYTSWHQVEQAATDTCTYVVLQTLTSPGAAFGEDQNQQYQVPNTGWPLVWKTGKCQGIWQLSGILLKIREVSGKKSRQGKVA